MNWQQKLNEDENGKLTIGRGFRDVYATLEMSGHTCPIYYYGQGKTVEEALEALDNDLNYDIDPMEADYEALARNEPMTASADSRDAAGI